MKQKWKIVILDTIVLFEFEKACEKACLRLWLEDSLFACMGVDVGMRMRGTAQGFRSERQCLLVGSCLTVCWWRGADPLYWSFHLSRSLQHCVLPFLPSQSIPLCAYLCPLTNHSVQMLFCTAVSQPEGMTSSFPHLTLCIAFTHSLFTVGPHLRVFICIKLIRLSLNYSIWSNLGFKCEITSSKCCFGGGPVSAWLHSCLVDLWLPSTDISTCFIFHRSSSPVSVYHI